MFWADTTTSYVTTFWTTWGALRIWTISPVKSWPGNESTVNEARRPTFTRLTSASSTLVSTCILVRSCAMVNSVGACRLAATVCPTSTVRETTTPSTGARMIVCSRSSWVCRNPASFWPTWAMADRSWASVTLRAASAERTPASCACSCALFASCWAIAES